MTVVARCITVPVRAYQRFISPLIGAHCRFYPSCSQYLIDAVRARGVLAGVALGALRLARCNPLFDGGYDPVDGCSPSGDAHAPCAPEPGTHNEKE
jgi:putative membrane protein insertion efficiency factor